MPTFPSDPLRQKFNSPMTINWYFGNVNRFLPVTCMNYSEITYSECADEVDSQSSVYTYKKIMKYRSYSSTFAAIFFLICIWDLKLVFPLDVMKNKNFIAIQTFQQHSSVYSCTFNSFKLHNSVHNYRVI